MFADAITLIEQRVAHTRGAFRHVNSDTFEDFRITDRFVKGEVAEGFWIGTALTVRVRLVRNERLSQTLPESSFFVVR
jgi:hypothetical protein